MYCNYDLFLLAPACILCLQLSECSHKRMSTVNPKGEEPPSSTRGHDETPTDDHEWVEGAGRQLTMPAEEEQEEAGMQHYAELDFAEKHPIPPPPSDMFVVAYAEVGQA